MKALILIKASSLTIKGVSGQSYFFKENQEQLVQDVDYCGLVDTGLFDVTTVEGLPEDKKSVLVSAIIEFMADKRAWPGKASVLLAELTKLGKVGLPPTFQLFGRAIRECIGELLACGIRFEYTRTEFRRLFLLENENLMTTKE